MPEQSGKDESERMRVQRVLDCHNLKYGTYIVIKGRTTDIYPELKGQVNWDWVCYEKKTGCEIAVEVKSITEEKLEAKAQAVYNLLQEVRNNLLNQLPGAFALFVSVPDDYDLPFRGRPENRERLKDAISEVIQEWAQRLDVGEKIDLTSKINKRLPFELPITVFLDLRKLDKEGHFLGLEPMIAASVSIGFDERELESFEQIVLHANCQLRRSNAKDTFLVLIEEGFRPIDPAEIVEAFDDMNNASYSEMRHVYFIRGKEVSEIPLPDTLK